MMVSPRSAQWRLPLALALSALALAFAPVAAAAQAGDAASPLQAQHDPPLRWVAWEVADLAALSTSADDQKRSTRGLLDGKLKTCTYFKKLEGSVTTLRFKTPRDIARLAFIQGGYANWAIPRRLAVIIDGNKSVPLFVELQDARGKIQAVPFGRTVRRLDIRVDSIWSEPGKTMPHGGFSGIGEAVIAPAEWPLVEHPLQSHQTTLRVTVTSPADTQAAVTASIGDPRRHKTLLYNGPSLALRAGTHDYTIDLTKLTAAEPYGVIPRPQNLDTLRIAAADPDTALRIEALAPVQPALPEAVWDPLPAIDFPTRQIDGQTWTEGHSYHTAGRFGNSTYNGLLTEVVSGNWFRAYTAGGGSLYRRQDFDFSIEGQKADGTDSTDELWRVRLRAWDPAKEKITANWTAMTLERTGKASGTTRVLTGVLAPGFLIDAEKPITLSSRGGGRLPVRSGAPDEDEARFRSLATTASGKPAFGPSAILTSHGLLTKPQKTVSLGGEPWLVAIWGIDGAPTFWGDQAVALLLTADTAAPVEWTPAGLRLPPGRWGLSTAFYGLLNKGWEPAHVAERARQLTRLLRAYPVDCREYYMVGDDDVRIRDEFRYERWGSPQWQAADYAPIPPLYSWARDSAGWRGVPTGEPSGIQTPVGPFRWVKGDTLDYSLPRIPARHAAWPRREEFAETYDAMEAAISSAMLPSPGACPSNDPWVIAYYRHWTQGLLGGGYYRPKTLQTLLDTARPNVERMYAPSSWILRRELFTGEPYYIRGWLDSTALPAMFGDPNSNAGQAAYSLYLYALYSGDWDTVRRLWPRVMDTLRLFEVLNDWAVPQTTSREAVKYSSIDMDTIAYAGVTAMERMAAVLGKPGDLARIAYLRAKIGAATALRFNFPRYLDPRHKYPALYGVGFAEDGPALESARAGNPVGLDHVAMCLTWTGEMPEMYDFYHHALGTGFFTAFQRDFMDNYFSDWRAMPYNQSRSAAHIADRARLPDWPAAGLKGDLDAWLAHTKQKTTPYEDAGMFGAYTAHDTQVWLTGWEPARFGGSRYDQATRTLAAGLESAQPFALEVHSPAPVAALSLDGSPQPLATIRTTGADHVIPLPHGGKIEIRFSPAAP